MTRRQRSLKCGQHCVHPRLSEHAREVLPEKILAVLDDHFGISPAAIARVVFASYDYGFCSGLKREVQRALDRLELDGLIELDQEHPAWRWASQYVGSMMRSQLGYRLKKRNAAAAMPGVPVETDRTR